MNTTDILQTLHKLAAEDRAWIIGRLPARVKAQLLDTKPTDGTARIATVAAAPPPPPPAQERMPADIDVAHLATMLAEEPWWVAAALLDGSSDPWAAAVLERLPTTMRADIAGMQRSGCALTPHAKQMLLRAVLARVGRAEIVPAPSRFQSLLARLSASRSRKRLTIHL